MSTSSTSLRIGIAGAGIGGLAAAIGLRRAGHEVVLFEQAREFFRVGADINLTPNAVVALDGLGVGEGLRRTAAQPTHRISRTYDTGEETSRLAMGNEAEQRYGSPQLTMHRADLLGELANALPPSCVQFSRKVRTVTQQDGKVHVTFEDGGSDVLDVLIGADGIHSAVRTALFGQEHPRFTGVVAFRAVVPADRVSQVPNLGAFTKWWGPNPQSQIVTFPLNRGKDIFIFATVGQDSWQNESWTTPGHVSELNALYADYHPEARALLAACDSVLKSALYERDPLPRWTEGHVTLLGDAAHPMLPFMAQGAGMAVEDAVVLTRALTDLPNAAAVPAALLSYEAARRERTSRIQLGSRGNEWMRGQSNADWVYGYNAWKEALPAAGAPA